MDDLESSGRYGAKSDDRSCHGFGGVLYGDSGFETRISSGVCALTMPQRMFLVYTKLHEKPERGWEMVDAHAQGK